MRTYSEKEIAWLHTKERCSRLHLTGFTRVFGCALICRCTCHVSFWPLVHVLDRLKITTYEKMYDRE
jgi:hypothetical protein